MAGVNKVILIGNLGKDPEVKHFESGSMVVNFSIATSPLFVITGVPPGKHIGTTDDSGSGAGSGSTVVTFFPKKFTPVAGDVIEIPLIT